MRKALFRSAAIAAAVALFTGVALANQPTTPEWFPEGFNLDSNAYVLVAAGDDRYQTAGTIGLLHSTATGDFNYPFNHDDKADASDTWGVDACDESGVGGIGVAAGDTSADALAASPAKDFTSLNVGAAVNDPDDTTADLDAAYMLLTNSTREGATTLNSNLVAAVQKMKDETSCDSFDVVIFGREEAVPTAVYDDLDALNGGGDVFVIGGVDRYETAQKIGQFIFFENGLPELDHYPTAESARDLNDSTVATADSPTTLNNVVFLAEGVTGADALTIGPVAAANNAPVFLTETNNLPSFTSSALATTNPDTIIVLGGTAAISDSTASAAATAGSATVIRIGGADRYETSVLISEQLFGYYGENQSQDTDAAVAGEHFDNLAIGFGRSEGAGAAFVGWPDVLASAWFLDEYDDESEDGCFGPACTPGRAAPDIEQNEDYLFIGNAFWDQEEFFDEESENQTPLLVVQQGSVPASVDDYLESLWTQTDVDICSADPADPADETDCNNQGGFGFVFGGSAAIAASVRLTVADHLSGNTYATTDITPSIDSAVAFFADLDWTTYTWGEQDDGENNSGVIGDTGDGEHVCVFRNGLTAAQFFKGTETTGDEFTAVDIWDSAPAINGYVNAQAAFPRYQNRMTCIDGDFADEAADALNAFGQSLSGHESAQVSRTWPSSNRLSLGDDPTGESDTTPNAFSDPEDVFTGTDTPDGDEEVGQYQFSGTTNVTFNGTTFLAQDWTLDLTLTRRDPTGGADGGTTGDDTDRITVTGTLTVTDGTTLFTATLVGDVADPDNPLEIHGYYTIGTSGALGGWHATLEDGEAAGGGGGDEDLLDFVVNGNSD